MSVTSLASPQATINFAAKLAGICKPGDCILLYGDVGVGKTTFARGFIQSLTGASEEVVSPTFTLVQTYDTPKYPVWHCDLYRLKTSSELVELGLNEALDSGIILVEWPGIGEGYFPKHSLKVTLDISGQGRMITINNISDDWAARLKDL